HCVPSMVILAVASPTNWLADTAVSTILTDDPSLKSINPLYTFGCICVSGSRLSSTVLPDREMNTRCAGRLTGKFNRLCTQTGGFAGRTVSNRPCPLRWQNASLNAACVSRRAGLALTAFPAAVSVDVGWWRSRDNRHQGWCAGFIKIIAVAADLDRFRRDPCLRCRRFGRDFGPVQLEPQAAIICFCLTARSKFGVRGQEGKRSPVLARADAKMYSSFCRRAHGAG